MKKKEIKPLIIVVDMIEAFCRVGRLANPRAVAIIPRIAELLERKKNEGCQAVFLCDVHAPGDDEFKLFGEHAVDPREREIVPELKPFVSYNVPKGHYNGFYATGLDGILWSDSLAGTKRVIVVGVCTDICVHYTTEELRNRGYKVVIPANCVETYDAPGHNAEEVNRIFLNHMEHILGAKVVEKQEET